MFFPHSKPIKTGKKANLGFKNATKMVQRALQYFFHIQNLSKMAKSYSHGFLNATKMIQRVLYVFSQLKLCKLPKKESCFDQNEFKAFHARSHTLKGSSSLVIITFSQTSEFASLHLLTHYYRESHYHQFQSSVIIAHTTRARAK